MPLRCRAMPDWIRYTPWDMGLLGAVVLQSTVVAYLHDPKWKAMGLVVPIPFTLATLAVGEPVGPMHATGLLLLLGYTYGVALLYNRVRLPAVLSIVLCAAAYCVVAMWLAAFMPRTEAAFWLALGFAGAVAATLHYVLDFRLEPGHRTPLPLWVKLPSVSCVVIGLVVIKHALRGFMVSFPMVGVIASYEARRSLGTVCRFMNVTVMAFVPMMAALRLTQERLGLPGALAAGWAVYLMMLVPLVRGLWRQAPAPLPGARVAPDSQGAGAGRS